MKVGLHYKTVFRGKQPQNESTTTTLVKAIHIKVNQNYLQKDFHQIV